MCFTEECFENQVDFLTKRPIQDVSMELLNLDTSFLPAQSSEELFFLPLIFPIVSIVVTVLGLIPTDYAAYCHSCNCCLIFLLVPWIFVLTGFLVPAIAVVGDVCYGAFNVGNTYVLENEDSLCPGNVTDGVCLVQSPLNHERLNNVSVADIYFGIFGECPADAEEDPIRIPITQLVNDTQNTPQFYLDMFEDSFLENGFRSNLTDIFQFAADDSAIPLVNFGNNLVGAVGCNTLNTVVSDVKDAFCCDFASAVYWGFGVWAILAWTMCCLGVPASLLGRKRLTRHVWGPDFEAAKKNMGLDNNYEEDEHGVQMTAVAPGGREEAYMVEQATLSPADAVRVGEDQMAYDQTDTQR
jgi:hypothetical protein